MKSILLTTALLLCAAVATAQNTTNDSFDKSKRLLLKVYFGARRT